MNNTYLAIGAVILAVGFLAGSALAPTVSEHPAAAAAQQSIESTGATGDAGGITPANCVADDCLAVDELEYPAGELPRPVRDALAAALADEYKAHATYAAIIDAFGAVRPFSMIIRAEETHIASLKALFDKYGIPIPADATGPVHVPDTLGQSCAAGVAAEIANATLYETQLIPVVALYPDITAVFTNLMTASRARHLPAFQRCSA